jgi:hypothetical protein
VESVLRVIPATATDGVAGEGTNLMEFGGSAPLPPSPLAQEIYLV